MTQPRKIVLNLLVKIDELVRNLQALHLLFHEISEVDFFAHRVIHLLEFSRVFKYLNELVVCNLLDLLLDILVESLVHGSNHRRHRRLINFALLHQKVIRVVRVPSKVDDQHGYCDK